MSPRAVQISLLILPLVVEIALMAFCWAAPGALRKIWPAYLIEVVLVGPVAMVILLLARHQWSTGFAIVALALQSLLILVLFAQIYSAVGMAGDGAGSAGFADGLYFSVITWTTVGYGDFKPVPELRLFAACEALYGYVFLGLIVGLIGSSFDASNR